MLKQPLICRSSKPRLDTFQKPYIPKEKRVSTSATGCFGALRTLKVQTQPLPWDPEACFPALTTALCLSLWLYEVTDLFLALCQAARIPIPPPRKTRAQLLDDILIRMRDPRNVTEAPLGMLPAVPPG